MSSTALRVKELLREKGWTTKVLAEKTGCELPSDKEEVSGTLDTEASDQVEVKEELQASLVAPEGVKVKVVEPFTIELE